MGSPKALNGKCVVRDPKNYEEYKEETYVTGLEYMEAGAHVRTTQENRNLYPKSVTFIHKDNMVAELRSLEPKDWVVLYKGDKNERVESFMKEYILNPGCLYILDDNTYVFNVIARAVRDIVKYPEAFDCSVKKYYSADKIVYFSLDDPIGFLTGGICESEYDSNKKIDGPLIIYGAGMIGKMVMERLDAKGISDYYVAVTEKNECDAKMNGHVIYELSELTKYAENGCVLIAATSLYHKDMVEHLKQLGFRNYRYLA